MLTVGSLFSGIGGIDLGLERAGMSVIWQAETDPYASKVLAKHWPDVPNLGDVTLIDWSDIERPDVVAGGFPCQPVSTAGRGLAQADERWLWPEVARCLRHLRPRWALLENVPGLLVQAMGDVLGDLAEVGYDAEWTGIPAAAVGAPHLRWRIFILAHAAGDRLEERNGAFWPAGSSPTIPLADSDSEPVRVRSRGLDAEARAAEGREEERQWLRPHLGDGGAGTGHVADANYPGRNEQRGSVAVFEEYAALECSSRWEPEPDVGRVAHGIPHRVDRLRCLGNAVVPQVAEYVGRLLVHHSEC